MLKQYVVIFGLGLTLSLAGCAQTETEVPATDQAKSESADAEKRTESQRPRGDRGDRQGRTPPEAANTACASLAAPRGTREGICRTRPGDERAFCAPQRPNGARGEGRGEGRGERRRPGGGQ